MRRTVRPAVLVRGIASGAGADERQELLAKEREYDLKIVVADQSGDYLAGVRIVIGSAGKERVLMGRRLLAGEPAGDKPRPTEAHHVRE